jgi:putative Mg2+ transporter-C (MgtC) family protein
MANPWLQWWTDAVPPIHQTTFPRLTVAMLMGVLVGAERQWRQRAAGLRTTTLVCFGAAAFVDLGSTVGGANSTGVIAYVVSGVGFLGAGAIIKDGASIRGLNTAATLWCSAAVGACAGAGELFDSIFIALCLLSINLVFRPLSRFIDRRSLARTDTPTIYRITAVCPALSETEIRSKLLRSIAERPLILRQLRTRDIDEGEDVALTTELESSSRNDSFINEIASALRFDPNVTSVEISEGPLESE